MQEALRALVSPVFRSALRHRDGWARHAGPPFDVGRAEVAAAVRAVLLAHPPAPDPPDGSEPYLGVGYALVCWADELFTLNSPVAAAWNERKFEVEFFATNDRAWRFWRQARLAADRRTDDDLEVFFLCAALGFRGEWADAPADLRTWFGATRERLLKGLRSEWVGPPALDPPARVPPRYGRDRVRRMAVVAGIACLAAVPAAVALVARHLAR